MMSIEQSRFTVIYRKHTISLSRKLILHALFSLLLLLMYPLATVTFVRAAPPVDAPVLAEFTQLAENDWFNSKPLKTSDLEGKVVLLDFWTFDCWNCYRSFPWLHALGKRYKNDGLQLLGVHTPEFDHEKIHINVAAKIDEFGIDYPVMVDNDRTYWKAMKNRYWPAYYLVDKQGRVRAHFIGETHAGSRKASAIENRIKQLLAE